MKFHVEFEYRVDEREKLFHFLQSGGLQSEEGLKLVGAWIAVETRTGYAIIETDETKPLYQLCSNWSEYGQVKVTPLLSVKELPIG